MDVKQLEYFVAVAEHRSFSRASVSLAIAQSALSRQVRALEVELRETLLLRTGRGVELTEAGQRLYERSVVILQQLEQARAEMSAMRDEPVGPITIGLPPSLGRQLTLPLIDGFRRQMPKARLAIVEGLSSHIGEWIAAGRVDLGLVYNPETAAGLELEPVLRESLCLVGAATGPDAGERGEVALADLPRIPLILPQRPHVFRRQLESQATLAGLRLDVAWEVSSVAAIIDLVCAGYGHAVLTAGAVSASGRADELRVRPLTRPSLQMVLCLATPANRRETPLARQGTRLLRQLVQSLPQALAAASLPG